MNPIRKRLLRHEIRRTRRIPMALAFAGLVALFVQLSLALGTYAANAGIWLTIFIAAWGTWGLNYLATRH
jgi:hypothetical protein